MNGARTADRHTQLVAGCVAGRRKASRLETGYRVVTITRRFRRLSNRVTVRRSTLARYQTRTSRAALDRLRTSQILVEHHLGNRRCLVDDDHADRAVALAAEREVGDVDAVPAEDRADRRR